MHVLEAGLVAQVKAMTRKEIILKAMSGKLTWVAAADILGITARHMGRLKRSVESGGFGMLRDQRAGSPRRKRIPSKVVGEILRLKREVYPDFSVKHFHEFLLEKHKLSIGYTWTNLLLQDAGLAEKFAQRGKYHRKRERRPMVGMLLHMDASTHLWLEGLEPWDLVVCLDDADGRILFAQFFPQEGTFSTLVGLNHVLRRHGRFCEFYTDRGAHFCRTAEAGAGPADEQTGQVSRALKALGIRHILARTPQARGRSERAFGTIQGRLPQELRLAGVKDYAAANQFLKNTFIDSFNRLFTVKPAQPESAFTTLDGIEVELLLSIHHERIVQKDNTVAFKNLSLQLNASTQRLHFVRCPVLVHELVDNTLAISFQGNLLERFSLNGVPQKRDPSPASTPLPISASAIATLLRSVTPSGVTPLAPSGLSSSRSLKPSRARRSGSKAPSATGHL